MALISGGRLNIWNAVKKQFEVVHPETEIARITDFADGIVQKLAMTSAMTAVTALQTDSWFGKLLKLVLNASGVKYNIAQNGYVCLGSFFGGLIIQWGSVCQTGSPYKFTFPISFTTAEYVAAGNDYNPDRNPAVLNFYDRNNNYCMIDGRRINQNDNNINAFGVFVLIGW